MAALKSALGTALLVGTGGFVGALLRYGLSGFVQRQVPLSSDLPIVIEIVDTEEKIEGFLPLVDGAVGEGLVTVEKVEVRFYRSGNKSDS